MDDVPAGPASPKPRRPSLSVVVPVRNGGRNFEHCLQRLRASKRTDFELIVVDDGSTDNSADVARAAGARVISNPEPMGPAGARNLGANAAQAPLLFFLDADVAVHPHALGRAAARFDGDPALAALFGSYDDSPPARGIVSRYRNLLHHFVHQQGTFHAGVRPVHTFWTGCGAMRRALFLQYGGFDPHTYPRPAIEDIELGYRLTRAGHRIVLARDVLATHLKCWTLREMVRTDIFQRGVPWLLLLKRTRMVEKDLNVKADQKACVAITGVVLCAALLSVITPWAALVSGVGIAAIVGLNHRFFRFLLDREGALFACAALALQLVYYCCCGISVMIAACLWHVRPTPVERPLPAAQPRADRPAAAIPPSAARRRSLLSRFRSGTK
jgi:GT2 family glycosyltransferase